MKIFTYIVFAIFVLVSQNTFPQIAIPTDYFEPPLKIGLSVSGSFSEIRANHFHSGIDLQVQQLEGMPVFAVADGYVSRVKISPVGFGHALYIDHPNGFTSVYGHLKGYNDSIEAYVREKQYQLQRFEVDLFPATKLDTIPVKKGELIGFAGNSGTSFGAHLHFELRNTKTEHIINPLLFGFEIPDKYPPTIDFIKVYPESAESFIGGSNQAARFNVKKISSLEYRLARNDTLTVWGDFSIGAQASDFQSNPNDRNGWYKMKMLADGKEFFSMACDSFAFDETRYVNASMDYQANYLSGNSIVKSKKLPGNQLSFFRTGIDNGVLSFTDNAVHQILVSVSDFVGNNTKLVFWVKPEKPTSMVQVPEMQDKDTLVAFFYSKNNVFETPEIKINIPAGSLYEDIIFWYKKLPKLSGMFSEIHQIHDAETPLHSRIKVSIKADKLPKRLRAKALLARVDRNGKRTLAGGAYENGFVSTTTNQFDGYAIVVDTIPPTIKPLTDKSKHKTSLKFKVGDNFSGIKSYRGEVNGKWVLVEWDPKNHLMFYDFDSVSPSGKNTFSLVLEDEKGNKSSYKTTFTVSAKKN